MANLRADNLSGTGFVSANDGTIWSDYVASTTGSTLSGYPATYGFDGNLSNFVYADNNSTITWTAPNGGIKAGRIEVYVYAGNTHPLVRVNGKNTGAVVGSATPDQRGNWVDVTSLVDGHLKTIEADGYAISGTARSSGWSAVRINGEILVDGEQGRTGGREAIDGSVFFEGESSYLEMASGVLISGTGFGTNDFTIEFWINQGVNASDYTILFAYTSSTNLDRFEVAMHSSTIQVYTDTGTWRDTGYAPVSGVYEHIAFVRNYSGNTLKMYANGVEKWSVSNNHDYNEAGVTQIGSYGSSSYGFFEGYFSNVRVLNGTALYTTNNFTPPTEKLKPITNTILLCCQDSDDPTQEATGKTITAYGNLDYSLRDYNLITNGNFDSSATDGWTVASGSAALGTGQSGTFGDGNHLVLTGGSMYQAFTTVIGRTYFVNAQSNGGDSSYISTSTSTGDAIITDIRSNPQTGSGVRGQKSFVATQTTYYVILAGGGTGNFDTVSVYEAESPKAPKVLPPVGVDPGVTFQGDTKINSQSYMYFPTGDTSQRGRGRAVFAGGYAQPGSPGAGTKTIDYINIQSGGISQNFGSLSEDRKFSAGLASATRGVFGGSDGTPSWATGTMEYVTIATTSNTTSFGNMTQVGGMVSAHSNNTRGLFFSVWDANTSGASHKRHIDYITIASAGNAADFGELSVARPEAGGFGSPTRGICAGGYDALSPNNPQDTIDYVTIATLSNATDFGDLTVARQAPATASSQTRGVIAGGLASPVYQNVIDYVTIATTGSEKDFGDLTTTPAGQFVGNCSDQIRGVFAGGKVSAPTYSNSINYVTIATTGNAQDFGDLVLGTAGTVPNAFGSVCSDSHGGLS